MGIVMNVQLRNDPVGGSDSVVLIGKDDARFEQAGFLRLHPGVSDNDQDIADLDLVVVHNLHFFAFHDVGRLQKVFVDGDAAHIVQVGFSDLYPMNLGFKTLNDHSAAKIVKEYQQ